MHHVYLIWAEIRGEGGLGKDGVAWCIPGGFETSRVEAAPCLFLFYNTVMALAPMANPNVAPAVAAVQSVS